MANTFLAVLSGGPYDGRSYVMTNEYDLVLKTVNDRYARYFPTERGGDAELADGRTMRAKMYKFVDYVSSADLQLVEKAPDMKEIGLM